MFTLPDPDAPLIVENWPVDIDQPTEGGKSNRHRIRVHWRILPQSRTDELTGNTTIDELLERRDTVADLIREALVGWKEGDVMGPDEQPIAFSKEAVSALLEVSYVRQPLVQSYFGCAAGRKAKN